MKNIISEWYNVIQNYLSLQKLKKENTKIEWNNITIKNIKKIMDHSDCLQDFYQVYQVFQNLEEDLQKWSMENLVDCCDIMQLTDDVMGIFYEKVFLSEVHPEIVRNKKRQISKIEFILNADLYSKILSYLGMGTITLEEIDRLDSTLFLSFLNDYPDVDILGLLALSNRNREIYIKEYQASMEGLLDDAYSSIQSMKSDNFKILVEMIKQRYTSSTFYDRLLYSYDYLEELAKVYGQSEESIANFVFHAFPDFTDVFSKGFQNGMIDMDFQKMVAVIMDGKNKEELDRLKNTYFEFLNHPHFALKELRYQLLMDSKFLASSNREEIMGLLAANDTSEYIDKLEMLLASGIYEADKLDASDYGFIKGADEYLVYEEKKEAMRRRIQLVLTPSISESFDREAVIAQINECSTFDDERKIIDQVLGIDPFSVPIVVGDNITNDTVIGAREKNFVFCKNKACNKS